MAGLMGSWGRLVPCALSSCRLHCSSVLHPRPIRQAWRFCRSATRAIEQAGHGGHSVSCQAAFSTTPHYADLPLDRKQPEALAELQGRPSTRFVAVCGEDSAVVSPEGPNPATSSLVSSATDPDGEPVRWQPALLPRSQITDHLDAQTGMIFLGLDPEGSAVFAASIQPAARDTVAAASQVQWISLRSEGGTVGGPEAALLAYARALVVWHDSMPGAAELYVPPPPTKPAQGGHARREEAQEGKRARMLFPRLDPAVIMLVSCGDWLLLGRNARWAPGRFSLLAGFVEAAETLEQAVVREVAEEAGVPVDISSVAYHSSQPWPFPRSLMIAFTAEAVPQEAPQQPQAQQLRKAAAEVGLTPAELEAVLGPVQRLPLLREEDLELEEALWFHRSFLTRTLPGGKGVQWQGSFNVPGKLAIARRVIASWLEQHPAATHPLEAVEDCLIDEGTFKYVLISLQHRPSGAAKLIVRGSCSCGYHDDVLRNARQEVSQLFGGDVKVQVLGGGRMEHHPEQCVLSIFGYSSAFGQAPHNVSAAIARQWLPLHTITVSYEGY